MAHQDHLYYTLDLEMLGQKLLERSKAFCRQSQELKAPKVHALN